MMINRFVANITHALQPVGLLLVRLVMGAYFLPIGYLRLMNLSPGNVFIHALIAIIEITGAVALVFGVFTELFATLLLVITVLVIMNKHAEISEIRSLLVMHEFLRALPLMLLAMFGAGKIAAMKTEK